MRKQAVGSPRKPTTRYNERSSKIWAPFRGVELSALRRAPVEDFIAERAAAHPRSAKNELEFLKKVLKDAQGRGHRIDASTRHSADQTHCSTGTSSHGRTALRACVMGP